MAPVTIILTFKGRTGPLRTIDEAVITKYSLLAQDVLPGQTSKHKTITVTGASTGPLRFVLGLMEKQRTHKPPLYVPAHKEPIDKVVMIFEAVEALRIPPAPAKLEGHIRGHLSHCRVRPHELIAVHQVFFPRSDTCRAWAIVVQQTAWFFCNGKYEPEGAEALQQAAHNYPELHDGVDDKIKELESRRINYDEASARQEGRSRQKPVEGMQLQEETRGSKEVNQPASYYTGLPKRQLKKAWKAVAEDGEKNCEVSGADDDGHEAAGSPSGEDS